MRVFWISGERFPGGSIRKGGERTVHYGRMFRILQCATSRRITDALTEMELTSAQGHIMGYLAVQKEAPCPKNVEEEFHLSHPTVSGLLSRLEKKDFIELRADPEDKRCKRIYILPRGRDSNEKIYHVILEHEEQILRGFSEEEKKQFADYLTRAARNLGCGEDF